MPSSDWWLVFKTKKEGNAPKELSNDLKDLKSGLTGAVQELTGFNLASIGLAGAVTGVAAGMKAAISDTLAYSDQVRDLARVSGASAEDTSRLIQVTDDLGVSYETLKAAARGAAKNGIALTTESLGALQKEYQAITDPAKRAQFAMETFGKSGLEMQKVLEMDAAEFRNLADAVNESMIMTDRQVQAARELEVNMDNLEDSVMGVKLAFGNALIPVLNSAYTAFMQLIQINSGYTDVLVQHEKEVRGTAGYTEEMRRAAAAAGLQINANGDLVKVTTKAYGGYSAAIEEVVIKHFTLSESENAAQLALKNTRAAAMVTAAGFDEFESSLGATSLGLDGVSKAMDGQAKAATARLALEMSDLTVKTLYAQAAMGLTPDAARKLAEAMGLISPATSAALGMLDQLKADLKSGKITLEQYNAQVVTLGGSIKLLEDKTITITTNFVTNGTPVVVGGGGGGTADNPVETPEQKAARLARNRPAPTTYNPNTDPTLGNMFGEGFYMTSSAVRSSPLIGTVVIQDSLDLESFKRMLMEVTR